MKKLPVLLSLLFFYEANSQYYYKDLVSAADLNRQMKTYVSNNIHKVTAKGITAEGGASSGFSEEYEISSNNNQLTITTRINQTVSSLRHSFNDRGLVTSTVDSAAGVKSTSTYTYDANGKITSISNSATDADARGDFSQTEVHQYIYKDGKLEKMWRIINKTDSLELRFVVDENGNVIEERNYRRGVFTDPIYYYYDDKDRVVQKITTTSGQNIGYLIWRYLFDERGLKAKEALFNKEKQLQGRIDYSYN